MFEIEWLMLIVWFIALITGFTMKQGFFVGFAGLIGIMLGFVIMTDTAITPATLSLTLGLMFIGASFYLLYYVLFKMEQTGTKS